jgi:DNA (cytosine-5)-methyltransferase 1
MYKVLNLYAGIGGNRKLWDENIFDITAVEIDESKAEYYKKLFPRDTVIVADAHIYLLENFDKFDFIWSSPPCPSHSRINTDGNQKPKFPDMKLYEEIILLSNNWFKGLYCIENVIPYYKPLIKPTVEIDRHLFWSNFRIPKIKTEKSMPISLVNSSSERFGFKIEEDVKFNEQKRKILRNLVNPVVGLHIIETAFKIEQKKKTKQLTLFDK